MLSIPARSAEFRDNIAVTMGIGDALGVRAFNALYGNRVSEVKADQQDDLATENLTLAAKAAAAIGGTVLVEPVSGPKPYPLRTARDVIAVLDRVHAPNIGFLCDLFHLANNGDDIDAALAAYAHRIAHVQIADHPGRGEPGTGTLDLSRYLSTIEAAGYSGYVGLEYIPTTTTIDSLRWLRQERSHPIMSTIALIGLGIMGAPMSEHLVKAGHTVIGFNRSPGPVERLVEAGGKGATSVAEAVREADVIITMVPDSCDVEGLALGEDGLTPTRAEDRSTSTCPRSGPTCPPTLTRARP